MSAFLFWLKKAITYCVMPLTAAMALILAGLWISRRDESRRFGRCLSWLGILILLVASHRQVGLRLLAPLEQAYPAMPEFRAHIPLPDNLATCRYIVVLGGGHADSILLPSTSKLSPYALGRITEAVRLARVLPAATIITSGPGRDDEISHAEVMKQAAISLGISPERIVTTTQGRDTESEAIALQQIIGQQPFALVTSAWHMPRSMGLMRSAGLHPVACPTDYQAKINDQFVWSDWLWGIDGLERTSWACYERLGMLWAKLRGRIN